MPRFSHIDRVVRKYFQHIDYLNWPVCGAAPLEKSWTALELIWLKV